MAADQAGDRGAAGAALRRATSGGCSRIDPCLENQRKLTHRAASAATQHAPPVPQSTPSTLLTPQMPGANHAAAAIPFSS